jgi:ferredoxin
VVGDFEVIPGFRLPSARLATSIAGIAGATFYRFVQRRPLCDKKLCTRCRRCADNCPVQAINLAPYAAIDRKTCITCYCCVEICPERAMVIPSAFRGLVRTILGR